MFKLFVLICLSLATFGECAEYCDADKSSCSSGSTCVGKCGAAFSRGAPCQCDSECRQYGDCCSDYTGAAKCVENSCVGRCNDAFRSGASCQCDSGCSKHGNCCDDYDGAAKCTAQGSCIGLCNVAYSADVSCQCHSLCTKDGNCCDDYTGAARCTDAKYSCVNRCDEKYNKGDVCHCDSQCSNSGNCCDDYEHVCKGDDFSRTTNSIWFGDWNAAKKEDEITIDKQTEIKDSNKNDDLAPNNFFSYFNNNLLSIPTYAAFKSLLDNYHQKTGTDEDVTDKELEEVDKFFEEVMKTHPMRKAHEYLSSKGLVGHDEKDFVADLKKIWFELYSRSSGKQDSSGFEHVFVGEVKNGKVTGFHNWIQFYLEEHDNIADYYGWMEDVKPNIMSFQFNWNNYMKEISSMWIGRSPEFEMAMFTICFKEFPNKKCSFDMAGVTTKIQTYDQDVHYIGSAYPMT